MTLLLIVDKSMARPLVERQQVLAADRVKYLKQNEVE